MTINEVSQIVKLRLVIRSHQLSPGGVPVVS